MISYLFVIAEHDALLGRMEVKALPGVGEARNVFKGAVGKSKWY